jgi:hypothetical protein
MPVKSTTKVLLLLVVVVVVVVAVKTIPITILPIKVEVALPVPSLLIINNHLLLLMVMLVAILEVVPEVLKAVAVVDKVKVKAVVAGVLQGLPVDLVYLLPKHHHHNV